MSNTTETHVEYRPLCTVSIVFDKAATISIDNNKTVTITRLNQKDLFNFDLSKLIGHKYVTLKIAKTNRVEKNIEKIIAFLNCKIISKIEGMYNIDMVVSL